MAEVGEFALHFWFALEENCEATNMPHGEWQDLDDMLEHIDEPFFRFVDTILSLRVTDFFFAIAMLLSAVLLYSPVTPCQVRLRAVPGSALCVMPTCN